jgi:hypothetical protein
MATFRSRPLITIHRFVIHRFAIHRFTIHRFAIHRFTIHRFAIHRFTIRRFAIHRFTIHRLRIVPAAVLVLVLSLACMPRESASQPSVAVEVASIQNLRIEHVTPRRDFVGPLPSKLEWTAADGVDSYAVSVENEIEIPVFDQQGIKSTSVPWPKEVRIEPGTYYWRIVGIRGGRIVADSGRAAFVVMD